MKCWGQHKKWLAWLFNAWLDCFTVFHLGAAACLLATLRQNGWMDFYEIFRICRLWHKKIWNILGMMRLNPWIQDSFSIFWILVSYQHYGISDGWIFIIFSGYGHKEQLARLFHAWIDYFTLLKLGAAEVCGSAEVITIWFSYAYHCPIDHTSESAMHLWYANPTNGLFKDAYSTRCNFLITIWQGRIILGLQSNCGHPIMINTTPYHAKLRDPVGKWSVTVLTGHWLHSTWSQTRGYLLMWATFHNACNSSPHVLSKSCTLIL